MYADFLDQVDSPSLITIMGDSAGGNIALSLVEIIGKNQLPTPTKLVLISPAVNLAANLTQSERDKYEKLDPIVKITEGSNLISKMWANGATLNNPLISPIYGDCPAPMHILQFVGTHETLYPSIVELDDKLSSVKDIDISTFIYPNMDHVFVIDNLPESEDAIKKIIAII